MKILSKYILREHAGPFVLSVMVITFIMLLDRVLDLLNLIITKHLDIWTTTQIFVIELTFHACTRNSYGCAGCHHHGF